MSATRSRHPFQILHARGGHLAHLLDQARRSADLHQRVAEVLGADLLGPGRVADLRDGVLTLATPTGALATRLRYHSPEIRRKLAAAGIRVTATRFVVTPTSVRSMETSPQPGPEMSLNAARVLESTAAGIDHTPLADALRRLAANARRKEG